MALRLRASLLSMGLLVTVAVGALGYQTACGSSREPTALFLAVSSDLIVTEDLDEVGLFVSVNGEIKHGQVEKVRPGGLLALPGTISILDPDDPATPVHIRVVGYRQRQVVSVRDAISSVPPNRISVLRLPIQWLAGGDKVGGTQRTDTGTTTASGQVRPKADPIAGGDHFPEFARYFDNLKLPCPTNQTMVNGECKGLDVTELLVATQGGDHVAQVFGGASGIDEQGVPFGGACFPVATCYAGAERISLAELGADCTVPKTSAPVDRVNFGIRRKTCTEERCTIALDYTPEPNKATAPGWYEKDGRYQLPKGICDPNVRRDSVVEVIVTTTCKNKVAAMPTCGVWSAVDTAAATPTPIGPYFAASSDAGADAPDGVAPGPWAFRTLRDVATDVPFAVGLALSEDRIWVVGRTGRAAGYLLSNLATAGETLVSDSDAGTPQFPFIAARKRAVVAIFPRLDNEFAVYLYPQGGPLPSNPPVVGGRASGVFVTERDEPVFLADTGSNTSLKVYPPGAPTGMIHNLMPTGHHSSSLDRTARKALLAAGINVLSVDVPIYEATPTFLTTTIEASIPASFQTYRSLHVLGTSAGYFWTAYDDTKNPVVLALFRAARGGATVGEEWITELPVTDSVTQDVSPVVGDSDFVFFSNGRTVYGKRVASTKDTPPVTLHTEAATESILGLAYDPTSKSLYAVTERGKLFGGPVALP